MVQQLLDEMFLPSVPIRKSSDCSEKSPIFVNYIQVDASGFAHKLRLCIKTANNLGIEIDALDDSHLNAGNRWKEKIKATNIAILIR